MSKDKSVVEIAKELEEKERAAQEKVMADPDDVEDGEDYA